MSLKLNYFQTAANNLIIINFYHLNIDSRRKTEVKDINKIKIHFKRYRKQDGKQKRLVAANTWETRNKMATELQQ
jgi:hypothetical protein